MAGKEVGALTLSDKVFGAEVNGAVLHTAVKAYLANQRQGTQSTLTRTEVSGGGKKALEAERNWPRAPGLDPRASVDARRRRAWPQTSQLSRFHQ